MGNSVMQSGVLLIDKPEGPSSAQVVHTVKVALGAKKVGHLGTLDPFASGLLLLGINEGTKIAEFFLAARKSYRGVAALGVETDTQDSTGKIVATRDVPALSGKELENLQASFTGTLQQTPPMFSALKRSGVRLYRLARQGRSVPRAPREIKIERLQLWLRSSTEVEFEVTCSKGTYIRTLAADMGAFLGCGAHLNSLRRLSCGDLSVEQAVSLKDIETAKKDARDVPLLSLNQALRHIREARLEGFLLSRLRMGQQEVLVKLGANKDSADIVRIVDSENTLVALVRWDGETTAGRWRLLRVFAS